MVSEITMKCSIIRKPKLYCVFVLIIFHSNPASVPSPTLGPPSLQCVPGTPFPRLQWLSRVLHHSLSLFIYSYFHIPEICGDTHMTVHLPLFSSLLSGFLPASLLCHWLVGRIGRRGLHNNCRSLGS